MHVYGTNLFLVPGIVVLPGTAYSEDLVLLIAGDGRDSAFFHYYYYALRGAVLAPQADQNNLPCRCKVSPTTLYTMFVR